MARLGADLQREFPGANASARATGSTCAAWPRLLLPLGHLPVPFDLVKDRKEPEWYLLAAVENGWSRNVLVLQSRRVLRRFWA